MSLGGEIMEELYELHIIPSYHKLLKECLELFKESAAPGQLYEIQRLDIIKKIESKLGERKD